MFWPGVTNRRSEGGKRGATHVEATGIHSRPVAPAVKTYERRVGFRGGQDGRNPHAQTHSRERKEGDIEKVGDTPRGGEEEEREGEGGGKGASARTTTVVM